MKNLPILMVCFFVTACSDHKTEIEMALKQYDRLTFKMDADSLADTYVASGRLGGKTMKSMVGRDSIRQFLKSFDRTKITLISNRVTATSVVFKDDTAVVDGTYEQKAKLGGDTGVYTG